MKTPKALPWLARRAGVSDSRAELLWRAACLQAVSMTGEHDGPRYWDAARERLLDLLARERWRSHPPFAWPWLLAQTALEGYSRIISRCLRPIDVPISPRQIGNTGTGSGTAWRPLGTRRHDRESTTPAIPTLACWPPGASAGIAAGRRRDGQGASPRAG